MRFFSSSLLLLVFGVISPACGSAEERPPTLSEVFPETQTATPECEEPPVLDTSAACGNETFRLFEEKPTIYFVLDVSGSMAGSFANSKSSKLDSARNTLIEVTEDIGHRIRYGLTTFPGEDEEYSPGDLDSEGKPPLLGCAPGAEAFPITEGDPIKCLNKTPNGPVLREFRSKLAKISPWGGTSLAPTMDAIAPIVLGQEGKTAVVLITDGAPNCNPDTTCGPDQCEPNITGGSLNDVRCDEEFNCCDPENVGDFISYPGALCVDDDASVQSLRFLHENGVDTYVVGVLGESDFDDIMNRLAIAGGQANEGENSYYDVDSVTELSDTISAIGSRLAQQCTLTLKERPPFANQLNVYFDATIVPYNGDNGWTLDGDVITLHGDACEQVSAGEVNEVQLLAGCETIVR